jgi:glutaredoxin
VQWSFEDQREAERPEREDGDQSREREGEPAGRVRGHAHRHGDRLSEPEGLGAGRASAQLLALLAACLLLAPAAAGAGEGAVTLVFFTRAGCPHCARARPWLEELARRRPELRVVERDAGADAAARARLLALCAGAGIAQPGVPAFAVGERVIVGFDDAATSGPRIEALLAGAAVPARAPPSGAELELPLFGRVSPRELGLPVFTLAIGFLDGLNPCATWALLFLLSLLVHLHSRARMLLLGGAFVVTSGVVYFAFMAAWLNVFLLLGASRALEIGVGLAGLASGALHAKEFFAFGRGPSLHIPEAAKPGLAARARRILRAPGLPAALAGAVALAAAVNVVELLCTAGLPALYTGILSERGLPAASRYGYLALYNLAYVFDDLLLLAIGVATLGHARLRERTGRWLDLAAGLAMMALGAAMLLRPGWLAF